jgi:CheY-like chemotaxis protein
MSAAERPARRILVVEDDDAVRKSQALLPSREGYEVAAVANGAEALAVLGRGQRPELILLDMLMPALDGWEFLQELRRQGPQPPPVVVITSTILTPEWARDHGCQGFLHKPVEKDQLLAEVRRCLAEAGL